MPEQQPRMEMAEGILQACEAVAASPEQARQAYLTWALAQTRGWPATRQHFPRRTWFRHLAVLREAGVPVPRKGHDTGPRDLEDAWQPPGRPLTPAQVFGLVGRRFQVLRPWDADLYPAGSVGVVDSLVFRDAAWRVAFDMETIPATFEEMDLAEFLRSTGPLEADHGTD